MNGRPNSTVESLGFGRGRRCKGRLEGAGWGSEMHSFRQPELLITIGLVWIHFSDIDQRERICWQWSRVTI